MDRATEVEELIYLRWSNACLRHELANMVLGHCENGYGEQASTCSKRKKFVQRLKKWVEGSEKGKGNLDGKVRHEIKCFGRHSVSDDKEEHAQGRRSCSSA